METPPSRRQDGQSEQNEVVRTQRTGGSLTWSSLPRLWQLTGYLLPKDVREKEFNPSFEDLYQDYLLFLRKHRGGWVRFGQNVLFVLWTSKLITECFLGMFRKED